MKQKVLRTSIKEMATQTLVHIHLRGADSTFIQAQLDANTACINAIMLQ